MNRPSKGLGRALVGAWGPGTHRSPPLGRWSVEQTPSGAHGCFLPEDSDEQEHLGQLRILGCELSLDTDVPGFPVAQTVKNPPAVRETWVLPLGWEDPLEEGMATHSSQYSWPGESPWTKEPGGQKFMGSQRVRHD